MSSLVDLESSSQQNVTSRETSANNDDISVSRSAKKKRKLMSFGRHHDIVKTTNEDASRSDKRKRLQQVPCVYCKNMRKVIPKSDPIHSSNIRTMYRCAQCEVPLHPECFGQWHNSQASVCSSFYMPDVAL